MERERQLEISPSGRRGLLPNLKQLGLEATCQLLGVLQCQPLPEETRYGTAWCGRLPRYGIQVERAEVRWIGWRRVGGRDATKQTAPGGSEHPATLLASVALARVVPALKLPLSSTSKAC